MQASAAFHRKRSGQVFLEHMVLLAATVQTDRGESVQAPADWAHRPADALGQSLPLQASAAGWRATVSKGRGRGLVQSVDEVVQAWRCEVAFAVGSCVAWAAETHLAMAMASGQWFGDVSVRHQRPVSPPGPADRMFECTLGSQCR